MDELLLEEVSTLEIVDFPIDAGDDDRDLTSMFLRTPFTTVGCSLDDSELVLGTAGIDEPPSC